MSDAIRLHYSVPPDLLTRAMTAWSSPAARRPSAWRATVLCALGGAGVAGAVILLSAWAGAGDGPIWMMIGFGIGLVALGLYQQRQMARLFRMTIDAHARQGEVRMTLSPEGFEHATDTGHGTTFWRAVDAVFARRDATVIRCGGLVYPLPDAALSTDARRDRIGGWRA